MCQTMITEQRTMLRPQITRSEIEEMKREKAEKIAGGQQIYACIKKSSKYYGQGQCGALFPVFVLAKELGDYHVQGGPGGQYRLSDVNLYVVADGVKLRIK